jgi:superfamily II DNA or RNA helicase
MKDEKKRKEVIMEENKMQLYQYQESNFARLQEIFTYSKFAFNLSELGSGKSIIGLKLGESFNKIIVVSYPAVINQNWCELITKYKLQEKIQTVTINSLRGRKSYKLNNEYLTREDVPLEQPVFKTTSYWRQLCADKTLLIVDEFQMTKNKNIGAKALKALIGPILESKNSRVLLMSGTPIDNTDQILNYLKLLNLLKKSRKYAALSLLFSASFSSSPSFSLCEKEKSEEEGSLREKEESLFSSPSRGEESDENEKIENTSSQSFLYSSSRSEEEKNEKSEAKREEINCFNFDTKLVEYFKYHFLPKFSDKMPAFAREINGRLTYLTLGEKEKQEAGAEVESLANICKKIETTGKLEAGDSLTIKQHLQNIELTKIPELSSQIINILKTTQKKIVVALFYIKPINLLCKLLSFYNPQVLIGETKNIERSRIISSFQEPNMNCRLIIANADIISTGINLDDTTGLFPRVCFLSSNYKSMVSHQLFYRFCRITTKSVPEIKIIFCRDLNEDRVLEILNNKTKVLKDFSSSSIYLSDFTTELL